MEKNKQLGVDRVEILKTILPPNIQISFDTDGDVEQSHEITFIDIDKNTIYYQYYVTHECGCCGGFEDETDNLDSYLADLSETDFNGLVSNINYNTNKLK
jgi:hypothetical protein